VNQLDAMPPHKIGKSGIITRKQKVQFTQACPTAGFQGEARKTINRGAFDASPPSQDATVTAQSPTMLSNVLLAHGQQMRRIDKHARKVGCDSSCNRRDRSARWPQCFNVRGNSGCIHRHALILSGTFLSRPNRLQA
jgi:hypothetical protein